MTKTVIPDWIDMAAWNDWVSYRKEIKSPMTERAKVLCINLLEQHQTMQAEIINTSILNGWKGLFPPKTKNQSTDNQISDLEAMCK